MHIHRAGSTVIGHVPDTLQELLTGECCPSVFHQQEEQIVLFEGKGDFSTLHKHLVGTLVNGQLARYQSICSCLGMAAAKARPDARHQLRHAKGLDDVIICTVVQTLHLVHFGPLSRQHDDRYLCRCMVLPQEPEQRQTILLRQHNIEHNKLRNLRCNGRAEGSSVRKTPAGQIHLGQGVNHQFPDIVIVFNIIDHVRNTPLCFPVRAYSTHSAIFCAWSPMRS